MTRKERRSGRREARRLLGQMSRPHRGALAVGFLATLGVVGMRLALPWPLRGIVENVFPAAAPVSASAAGNEDRSILVYCGLYIVLAAGVGVFEWVQRLWMARVASRTAHELRVHVVSRLRPARDRSGLQIELHRAHGPREAPEGRLLLTEGHG